jgi:transcriptional regulator with XRE-family HTH domain
VTARQTGTESLARRVGTCIRDARLASGLSRHRVARSAGLTRRELAGYEHGRSVPSGTDLRALAGACGMSAEQMLPRDLVAALPESGAPAIDTAGFLDPGSQ